MKKSVETVVEEIEAEAEPVKDVLVEGEQLLILSNIVEQLSKTDKS